MNKAFCRHIEKCIMEGMAVPHLDELASFKAGLEAALNSCVANEMRTNDRFEVNAHALDEREIRKLMEE